MSQEQSKGGNNVAVMEALHDLRHRVIGIEQMLEEAMTMLRQLVQASGAAPPSGGLGH